MIDHETPCRQFLRPGEVLLQSEQYEVYPSLPLVPAHLRLPPKQSALEKRIRGVLGNVLGKASRPIGAVTDNRFTNNRLTRAVGNVAEGISEAPENIEDAIDDAAERMMYGKPMEGSWTSMAGRFLVQVTNAGGVPRHQAVTDRRLFVVTDHATGWRARDPEPALAVEVPRQDIAELRPRPRTTLPRGRFDLVFVDGSWIALCCSFQKSMESLVDAFYGRR
ncbi:hypothetical protein ACH4GK_17475 [Streptomyces rimosus]|uniref:hypothetical protein n=1 Tax=Streptomyces rimosus TaxID=1927 RepID=UPI0004C86684|nr:hypothetical protein [Streptomyces rimosus]KOT78015.1 hypothetical protein ADK70_35785 [Streptomyces rimosus subsp. pseudoverticillatus]